MNFDEPKKALLEIQSIAQDRWEIVAKRVGERDKRLLNIVDLPQDDRDLYLINDVKAVTKPDQKMSCRYSRASFAIARITTASARGLARYA